MGLYATFNTGFEYKFSHDPTDPKDILGVFGKAHDDGKGRTWDGDDRPKLILHIRSIEYSIEVTPIQFSEYDDSSDGTNKLIFYISKLNFRDTKKQYNYLLTSLLYHQLRYTDPLIAIYSEL
jgi:hypothetical protein